MPIPSSAPPPRRSLLREDVYARIRDAIVDGTFEPGEQLRDTDIAAWLGLSRTPVREALLKLGEVGLVRTAPGRSTTVATLDHKAIRDAQTVVASMHRLAVAEAADKLTADDLDQMREANARFGAALKAGDADAALAADDEFHAVPVRVAGNTALATVLEQFTPVVRRLERLRFSSIAGRGSVALHSHLVDLCEAGDAAAAADVSFDTWQTLAPILDLLDDSDQQSTTPTSTKDAR